MKKICLLILVLWFNKIFSQDFNRTIVDEKSNDKILIGYCNREAFSDTNYSRWFDEEYEFYTPKFSDKALLEEKLLGCEITIVMGTWCSDSQMEVPVFYKILDTLNYPDENLTLISVDRSKQGVKDEVDDLNIHFIPTFIFYKNKKEIGRIIEIPESTMEGDIEKIIY